MKATSPPTIIILLLLVFQAEGAEPINRIELGVGVGVNVALQTYVEDPSVVDIGLPEIVPVPDAPVR